MKMCTECGDYLPIKSAIAQGLVSGDDVVRARNDVRGCNGFCRCEGLINTTRKEDDGCLAFIACDRRRRRVS